MMETEEIFGIRYAVGDVMSAVSAVMGSLKSLGGGYICFSNVFTVATALDKPIYKDALNGSSFTFPDGAPIAKKLRKKGKVMARRIAGPDFMEALLKATADGKVRHFFYGSTEDTLDKLTANIREKHPDMNIVGRYSPPYRSLTADEDREIIRTINETKPDIVWIGLGAPKQEMFMYHHKDKISGLMVGVGAGFDYQAGTVKRAPLWMQRMSLEWFHRLITDPKRLAKRYLVTNTKYIWHCMIGK